MESNISANPNLGRVISVRVKNEATSRRRFSDLSDSLASSSSSTSDSVTNSVSSDDIFYIYQTTTLPADRSPVRHPTVSTLPRRPPKKHTNLDTKPLTIRERFRLVRIRYLNLPNSIRLALVLLCITLYGYVTESFLSNVDRQDTQILVKYAEPRITLPPAFTICTHCVLCGFMNDSVKRMHVKDFLENRSTWKWFVSKEETEPEHAMLKDSEIVCVLRRSTLDGEKEQIPCESISPVVSSMMYGHRCYTYFSDMAGHMRRLNETTRPLAQMNFDLSPQIFLKVNGYYLSLAPTIDYTTNQSSASILGNGKGFWANFQDQTGHSYTGLYIALHDPMLTPDMAYLDFHRLTRASNTLLSFIKREQSMLPGFNPPCFQYRSDSPSPDALDMGSIIEEGETKTSYGLAAYRSQAECFLFCLWRQLNTGRCANHYSSYTEQILQRETHHRFRELLHAQGATNLVNRSLEEAFKQNFSMKFCGKSYTGYQGYLSARTACLDACPMNCNMSTFQTEDIVEIANEYDYSRIFISWKAATVEQLTYKQKVTLSEVLATMGGNLHIFLKVSVIHGVVCLVHWFQDNDLMSTLKYSARHWWRVYFPKKET